MPPKASNRGRNVHRNLPYNLSLPENWTADQLKTELSKLGISFPGNARRSHLISLYKHMVTVTAEEPDIGTAETIPVRPSDGTAEIIMAETELPVVHEKNNNINNELLSVIRELSANVNALKKDMNSVTNDIQTF